MTESINKIGVFMRSHPLQIKVASAYLEANRMVTAKSIYLKAIDFSFFVLDRMRQAGYKFPDASLEKIKERLRFIRKHFSSDYTKLNELSQGVKNRSSKLLEELKQLEKELTPNVVDWTEFLKEFPNKNAQGRQKQSQVLRGMLETYTGVSEPELSIRLANDYGFAKNCYEYLTPFFQKAHKEIVTLLSPFGFVQSRIKEFESAYKKAKKKSISFVDLGDIIGCRGVTSSVPEIAQVAHYVQKNLGILEKENFYLQNKGYIAIHYTLSAANHVLAELQLKSTSSLIEAAISHDIVYKPEMSLISLTPQERKLVARVVNVSLGMTLKELATALKVL